MTASLDTLVPVLDELVPEVSSATQRRVCRPVQVPLRYPVPGNLRPRRLVAREYAVIDAILARPARRCGVRAGTLLRPVGEVPVSFDKR